jgi:undecaprenyl-diphosphatase
MRKGGTGMDWNILNYLIYGFVAGLSELLPVSSEAHGQLIELLTRFDCRQPVLLLCVHLACFLAVILRFRGRVGHIYRELRINRLPPHKRKRQPDYIAILDAKVLFAGLFPVILGVCLSVAAYQRFAVLPLLSLLLLLSGILVYIPQFLPGANKDSRSLSRKDALILGASAAVGVIPGISRLGTMISVGLMKGCERKYILDLAMLTSLPFLLGLMIVDVIMFLMVGTVVAGMMIVYLLLVFFASFAGAWLAIVIMHFLSVKSNFFGFAYYNWGLAMFAFLVYLMI